MDLTRANFKKPDLTKKKGTILSKNRKLGILFFSTFYFVLVLIYLIGTYFLGFKTILTFVVKPFPLCILIVIIGFLAKNTPKCRQYSIWVVFGLFFCTIRDILLMVTPDGSDTSTIGDVALIARISYLVGIFCYSLAFSLYQKVDLRIIFLVPYLLYSAGIIYLVYSNILKADLLVGLIIYISADSILCWRATALISRYPNESRLLQWLSAVGAILLFGSDSVLILNGYYSEINQANEIIMTLYYLGQLCICFSVPRRLSSPVYKQFGNEIN